MSLSSLSIQHFRNLQDVQVAPAAGINVVFGDNAAGKTSLLEAIHYLARGRSFRTTRTDQLVSRGAEELLVRGTVTAAHSSPIAMGILWTPAGTRLRVNGADCKQLSALARLLPVQVINAESQRLLQDGPQVRRSLLNWSLFHVEHGYHDSWRRYERALRQRNAALRTGDERQVRAWEAELAGSGELLSAARAEFVRQLGEEVAPLLQRWLPDEGVSLHYRAGWSKERSLAEALEEGRARELELGYGLFGPHRGDMAIRAGGVDAQHQLSRGQQKLLSIALLLIQARMLRVRGAPDPLLLVDDLPAELDPHHRHDVLAELIATGAQAFITCTEREALAADLPAARWFHVEHGVYQEVV